MKMTARHIASLAFGLAFAGTLAAQYAPPQPDDPPSRVARLSYFTGQVSFEPSTVNDWAPATLNYPLTTGDNLYTDVNGSRAVLRLSRNSIRLAPGTNFQMVNLSDQVTQMSINSGALIVKLRNLWDGESWEVDTPNGAVTLLRTGEYRIDTDPNRNATMVTVRSGDAEVTSNNQSFPVHARQTAYLDPNNQPSVVDMNPPDDFDQFGYSRDRLEDAPPPPYVSQYVTGYDDLAAYGTWQPNADYGYIWVPRVEYGWAPYHTGHWAWVSPWGWTWIDDSPWGFAPFHYGRWAYVNNYWGWVPGPVNAQAIYAPALVAFVGGGGFGIGIGGGIAVGWFALGPREPFYPSYHVSNNYVRNVNISNTTIVNVTVINNYNNGNSNFVRNVTYANQRVTGAVTAVPQNSFASGAPVQRAAIRITPEQIRSVQVVAAAPVVPQRSSVLGTGNNPGASVVRPPVNVAARVVVAKIAPPPPPVRFEAQQQALQQNPGHPVAPQQLQSIRQATPAAAAPRIPIKTVNPAQVHAFTPVPQATRPVVNNPAPASRPQGVVPAYTPPPAANRPATQPAYTPPPAVNKPATQPAYTPPPANKPAPAPAYNERPANAPAPQYTPRPQNAPPPVVNKPAPPPAQQHPAAAAPKPAPKPKEEKPKEEKPKEEKKE
jgi:hypothetical protein